MPAAQFPMGELHACPEFLAAVSCPALVKAIVDHFTSPASDGQPVHSRHEHEGVAFTVETAADRSRTSIRIADR